jgi:two-component system OmpR family sensor kinase
MTLRARLTLWSVALVALGLVAFGALTYTALRHQLLAGLDRQLQATAAPAARQLAGEAVTGAAPARPPAAIPLGTYAALVGPSGRVLVEQTYGAEDAPAPALPRRVPVDRPFDVHSSDGGTAFRVLVSPVARGSVVVAIPATDVQRVLGRLVRVELLGALVLLAALSAGALATVRRGLAPLADMEVTAEAIAGGELERRVAPADGRTEVGRLGRSLNVMLDRLAQAITARAASEARMRAFLADAAHELRTPLTSIRGYAELFRRGADRRPEDLATAMRRIEQESARMGVLVDDLLLLARSDEGRPLARDAVDLVALATDACADAAATAPDRSVSLDAPAPAVVTGDRDRLRQVVANLVGNALVHTPAGTPVDVGVRRVDGPAGARVELAVADRGPGLTPEEAARVFDRFWRADASRTRASGGAGLGLAVVDAVVRAHGGSVAVHQRLGGGAVFVVTLPESAVPASSENGLTAV